MSGDTIERIRIAVNGVAARPLRLKAVEDAVRGKPRNDATGEMAGKLAVEGADPAAVQRLQDSADAKPGEARHSRRAGGNVGIIEWATSPWGQSVPIHIAWFLMWVALIAGLLFLIVHAIYIRYFAKEKEFAGSASPELVAPVARAHSPALAGRAAVSLDHGCVDVYVAVYRVPAAGWASSSIGSRTTGSRVWC